MARRVVMLRHAKSSWDEPGVRDHDRALAPRGRRALAKIRAHVSTDAAPDLVLCSTARRAVDTLAGVLDALPPGTPVEYEAGLYLAGSEWVLDRLRRLDGQIEAVMVVGHNPDLHDLASELSVADDSDALEQLRRKFPTGAVATVSFEGEWSDLGPGLGRLEDLFTPRRPR